MTTFLDGVNRVLRSNTILAGDDADLTSFTVTQHKAHSQMAQISIQDTLTDLVADNIIPYEITDGTITYVTSQRVYTLPNDFIRFADQEPFLLELDGSSNSANIFVTMYPGGEEALSREVLDYRSQSGNPIYFYEVKTTTKQIGLYQLPDSSKNGTVARFRYQKSVFVTSEADTLPFHTTQEAYTFLAMASRYFLYINAGTPPGNMDDDPIYKKNKASLMNLIRIRKPSNSYGYVYL